MEVRSNARSTKVTKIVLNATGQGARNVFLDMILTGEVDASRFD